MNSLELNVTELFLCWETETRTRIDGVSDRSPNQLEDLPVV